ncbi:hypothetical protein [Desulfobulbus alkaliphilus]|uniref:hypothetical protein n=1 Tax=Desulfobulbus alkaliphilus TaxID=869814 RepID=UPI001964916E|nr:hypothetical protein [Desulfobulbus alkaliphilus]MBM9536290.1 hypothetical protein [Desulfobulbus alkaliphilus]
MKKDSIFDWACATIAEGYTQMDHQLGYRFLLGPKETLRPSTKILFLSLNPGGSTIPLDHPSESCEEYHAILAEKWGHNAPGQAPLQKQIQVLFNDLATFLPEKSTGKELLTHSIFAYYLPFRSPNYQQLHQKEASRQLAFALWSKIVTVIDPRLIICINNETFADITRILEQRDALAPETRKTSVGWGNITAEIKKYHGPGKKYCVLRFPHLSRFKIFARPTSKPSTDNLLAQAAEYIT